MWKQSFLYSDIDISPTGDDPHPQLCCPKMEERWGPEAARWKKEWVRAEAPVGPVRILLPSRSPLPLPPLPPVSPPGPFLASAFPPFSSTPQASEGGSALPAQVTRS